VPAVAPYALPDAPNTSLARDGGEVGREWTQLRGRRGFKSGRPACYGSARREGDTSGVLHGTRRDDRLIRRPAATARSVEPASHVLLTQSVPSGPRHTLSGSHDYD